MNKPDAAKRLTAMASHVQSGDPNNVEAQAARIYWPTLFGNAFRRGAGDTVNAALNYGYAVVRAFVARSQVAYGLIPAFGIHHNNQLNAFNLTDDLMEVFRPFVDVLVFELQQDNVLQANNLPIIARQKLANVGNVHCLIAGQTHTLTNGCEKMAAGLVTAIENKSAAILPLPILKHMHTQDTQA
jgi:CRISPR-associated protein Cas1